MTKIKNNKLLSLIIAFVVSFSFFSVFENVTVNAASSLGSVIDGGKVISAGNYLLSPNGNCKAVMQGDGNFVIYKSYMVFCNQHFCIFFIFCYYAGRRKFCNLRTEWYI